MTLTASSAPPAPAITSGPTGATRSTTATFAFTDATSGVQFQCRLDAHGFSGCSGRITYHDLADGHHTFQVQAKKGNSAWSGSATRAWTVDTHGPAVTLSFPQSAHTYGATQWNTGCSGGAGICGAASDLTGVAAIGVAVERTSAPARWWNGSSFASPSPIFLTATGTTTWRLPIPVPANGTFNVNVRATDVLGNARAFGSLATFSINTTPPPAPTLAQTPANPSTSTSAQFRFTDARPGVTFKCATDGSAPTACGSPRTYSNLELGQHTFTVTAYDAQLNASTPASYTWIIDTSGFHIAGSPGGLLYPGSAQRIDLAIGNPFNFPLKITSVTVSIDASTSSPACNATANFNLAQQLQAQPTVPANTTRTLSQLGVPLAQWPLVEMLNLPTNQDACKGAQLHLHFLGTGTQ